jgi:glutathione S-transferase
MALKYAGVALEHREVLLRDKPRAMLQASGKGTVPVLVLPDGRVIDESADVMRWALAQRDTHRWWRDSLEHESRALLEENDLVFKIHLDLYKYADRHPRHPQTYYRATAETFLQQLETMLATRRYLLDDHLTFIDVAIFPFVRQFAFVDKPWFDQAPYPALQSWLQSFLDSDLFSGVMEKLPVWREGQQYD